MAILDLLPAEFSGVGASELWPRAVEDRNMKFSLFGQSINQSIKVNVQLNLWLLCSVTCVALWLSHVIKSIQYQIVSIGPSNSQAVLFRWFENNILMAFKL